VQVLLEQKKNNKNILMFRYGNDTNKCTSTYNSILYYEYSRPPTCFSQSCGHTKGGALQRIYYKSFLTSLRMATGVAETHMRHTMFIISDTLCIYMHLLVFSPYQIRLMHGHGLFKLLILTEADLSALPRRKLCLTNAISCSASLLELFH